MTTARTTHVPWPVADNRCTDLSTHPFAFAGPFAAPLARLYQELRTALERVPRGALKKAALAAAVHFAKSLARRAFRALLFLGRVAWLIIRFACGITWATIKGTPRLYLTQQAHRAKQALSSTLQKLLDTILLMWQMLLADPGNTIPAFICAGIGLYLGSGGIDTDGGLPDLDLKLGVGHHRSACTHSIILGAFVESVIYLLQRLVKDVYTALPADHSPLWDRLYTFQQHGARAFLSGISLGLAAHLGADATIQAGKAYADLPISMSMTDHQLLMAANAIAEGLHAPHAGRTPDKPDARTNPHQKHQKQKHKKT